MNSKGGSNMPKKWPLSFLILLCASFLLVNQIDVSYMLKQGLIVLYVIAYFVVMVISRKKTIRPHKQ